MAHKSSAWSIKTGIRTRSPGDPWIVGMVKVTWADSWAQVRKHSDNSKLFMDLPILQSDNSKLFMDLPILQSSGPAARCAGRFELEKNLLKHCSQLSRIIYTKSGPVIQIVHWLILLCA